MNKFSFLKGLLTYIACVTCVCLLHMWIFGKASTINTLLGFAVSASTFGLYAVLATLTIALVCTLVYFTFFNGKSGNEIKKETEVTLDDVIISDDVRKELLDICDSNEGVYKKNLEVLGCSAPIGYLLYGPPGTGKTLLARAIAGTRKANFLETSGPELCGKYILDGPNNVKKIFDKAKKNAPCILFIDEIDAIGGKRNDRNTADTFQNKTTNQFLVEMSNLTPEDEVTVIGATNLLGSLDDAFKRRGRFDKKILIPLPGQPERAKILELYVKKVPIKSDLDFQELAANTEGFSGADLKVLVDDVKREEAANCKEGDELAFTMDCFNSVIQRYKSEDNKEKPCQEEEQTFDGNLFNKVKSFFLTHCRSHSQVSIDKT